MNILENFGFDLTLFVAQIINFLILAFIFKKFLYKPLLKTIKDRQKMIAKGVKDAEDAHVALLKAEEQEDLIIKKASKEAEKILEDTKNDALSLKDSILAEAKEDAEKIIKTAHAQATASMEEMEKRAKKASIDNSVAILSKALDSMLGKSDREKILEKSMRELRKYE